MRNIDAGEIEKSLRAWADLTLLSLELKRAALRKTYPTISADEINEMVRESAAPYGEARDAG